MVAFSLRSPGAVIAMWLLEAGLAIVLVLTVRRHLFPIVTLENASGTWLARWRRRGARCSGGVVALAALGLVLPRLLSAHHWLTPLSALMLGAILLVAALLHVVSKRPRSLAVAGGLLALTTVVAYSKMGELYWVGVLPW